MRLVVAGRNSRARLVSGVVDDEALGMLVVQGGARAAGIGQAQRQNPTLSVAHAGSYEDGDYKVQRMRIEQW